jgi:hypothetical protein
MAGPRKRVITSDNSKFLKALSAVGGDPLPGADFVGTTFFLENGWRIRPDETNHTLVVSGNLYTREGDSAFVNTLGSFNVRVESRISNLVDTIATGGSDLTAEDVTIAVWDAIPTSPVTGSYGEHLVFALGLSKHNHRILTPTYNGDGLLTSAKVRIYPTRADVEANTNQLNEYDVVATYNSEGLMTSYQMKEA